MTDPDDQLVELTTRPNELDAGLICEVVRAGGVECVTRQASGAALGIFGASSFNPISVMVRRGDLTAARRLLEHRRSESVDIDWSEVDVGEPADDIARGIAEREAGRASGVGSERRAARGGVTPMFITLGLVVLVAGIAAGPMALIVALAAVAVIAAFHVLRGR